MKHRNNNGISGPSAIYWLRSPSTYGSESWLEVNSDGTIDRATTIFTYGIAPAFCLAAEPDPVYHHKLLKNGKIIQGIYKNGKKLLGIAHNGELIWKYEEPKPKYRIMTVKIDQNNPDPETCCTYADDAVNMIPGSSDWDDFFGHYCSSVCLSLRHVYIHSFRFAQA